jgi:hypothetical protein
MAYGDRVEGLCEVERGVKNLVKSIELQNQWMVSSQNIAFNFPNPFS